MDLDPVIFVIIMTPDWASNALDDGRTMRIVEVVAQTHRGYDVTNAALVAGFDVVRCSEEYFRKGNDPDPSFQRVVDPKVRLTKKGNLVLGNRKLSLADYVE